HFFIVFHIGSYLSALVPYMLICGVLYPKEPIPFDLFIKENALYFIDSVPIIALQYLLRLRFRNFLVPVGVGFVLWVRSLASLSWKFGYIIPYTYCTFNYLKDSPGGRVVQPSVNIHYFAISYFVILTVVSY